MAEAPNRLRAIAEPGNRVLVIGMGRSGIGAVRLLKHRGVEVVATDNAPLEKLQQEFRDWAGANNVSLVCGEHSNDLLSDVDHVIASPGVPLDLPLLREAGRRKILVAGELALGASLVDVPLIAITGTNGKSTVTELIGEMFQEAGKKVFVGGNLGIPLCEYLLDPFGAELLVLEVSSFQLDTAPDFRPDVGILLNISPDHLDRYEDFDHYAASKFSIFKGQQKEDVAIVNADDTETASRLAGYGFASRLFRFGVGLTADNPGSRIVGREVILQGMAAGVEERYSLVGSALELEPNVHNAAAAIIAARLFDCPASSVEQAIKRFSPLGHRLEPVAEINGVAFLDDSKATNIGALAAALEGMSRPVILIAGGRDKGGDYHLLRNIISKKVRVMVLIGEAKLKMAEALEGCAELKMADDLPKAVSEAAALAEPGETVLLSPACASFDMFESYGHRGQVYKESVLALQ